MRSLVMGSLVLATACASPRFSEPAPVTASDDEAAGDTTERPFMPADSSIVSLGLPDSVMTSLNRALAMREALSCPMPVMVPAPGATVTMPTARTLAASAKAVAPVDCANPLFRPTVRVRPVPPPRPR